MDASTNASGTDRAGCLAPAWCGIHKDKPDDDPGRDDAYQASDLGIGVIGGDHIYCSAACRDARLPPLESKPPAPAKHPERRVVEVGQVYVRTGGLGQRITVAAVSDTHGTDKEGYPWALESFRNGVLTLLSDTSPDTPLCDCRSHGKPPHMRDNLCAVPAKSPPAETPKAHDFSDPYCAIRGERVCVTCGQSADAAGPCTPRPGWRERWDVDLANRGPRTNVLHRPGFVDGERLPKPRMASDGCSDDSRAL